MYVDSKFIIRFKYWLSVGLYIFVNRTQVQAEYILL